MKIKPLHPDFKMPERKTNGAGGYDLHLPAAVRLLNDVETVVPMGFAMEVPEGHVALLMPRSGVGSRDGLELLNTVGLIDSDYRGELIAVMRLKRGDGEKVYQAGDRLVQMVIVPIFTPELELATELSDTARGAGGFGGTGQ